MILRHLRVLRRLWLACIQMDLAYRWQIITDVLDETVSVAMSLLLFEIAFGHVQTIGGWSQERVILLVGIFQIYSVVMNLFFGGNLQHISRTIFMGQLDGLLLRPVSTQMMLSLREIRTIAILRLIPGVAIVLWSLEALAYVPVWTDVLACIALLMGGIIVVYAIWFASLTIEFWLSGLWSMESLVPELFDYGRFPDGIYVGMTKTVMYTVLPVVVVANYPLRALLGDWSVDMLLHVFGLAVVFLVLSRLQWRLGLRRYSSASS